MSNKGVGNGGKFVLPVVFLDENEERIFKQVFKQLNTTKKATIIQALHVLHDDLFNKDEEKKSKNNLKNNSKNKYKLPVVFLDEKEEKIFMEVFKKLNTTKKGTIVLALQTIFKKMVNDNIIKYDETMKK